MVTWRYYQVGIICLMLATVLLAGACGSGAVPTPIAAVETASPTLSVARTPSPAADAQPQAGSLLSESFQVMKNLKSVRMASKTFLLTGGTELDVWDWTAGERMRWISTSAGMVIVQSGDMVMDGKNYMYLGQTPGLDLWEVRDLLQVDRNMYEDSKPFSLSSDQSLIELTTDFEARVLGLEMAGDIPAHHVRFTPRQNTGDGGASKAVKVGDMWIGKDDHYVYREAWELDPGGETLPMNAIPTQKNDARQRMATQVMITYSRFNEPIEITPPDEALTDAVDVLPVGAPIQDLQALDLWQASNRALMDVRSVHLSELVTGPGVNVSAEADYSARHDSVPDLFRLVLGNGETRTEYVGVGNTGYVRVLPDGEWKVISHDGSDQMWSQMPGPGTIQESLGFFVTIEQVGSEVVDGVDTYHLRAVGYYRTEDLWIGKADNYLRRAVVNMTPIDSGTGTPQDVWSEATPGASPPSSASGFRIEIRLSKFNEPIEIKPPL